MNIFKEALGGPGSLFTHCTAAHLMTCAAVHSLLTCAAVHSLLYYNT